MIIAAYHLFINLMQIAVSQDKVSKYANKSGRQSGKHLASEEIKKINLSLPQYTNCVASKSIWLQDLLRQTLPDFWVKNFAHGFT